MKTHSHEPALISFKFYKFNIDKPVTGPVKIYIRELSFDYSLLRS